ncbi:DUF2244 domain-containing protein [Exilibacterium tricleocarpae]|uniref:DUF2244 domain-containing protein n=1 Tax=Exilibacterium tricleocarpae TaxID=2591008 RepID=A0A545T8G8_9GAMM|nr:DUF2244 domain-containing protein [Exilibacterium tricleocarpae]TQV73499.1 DUF2244 domain-containing protein [Exilibacterium tricleocarpae]
MVRTEALARGRGFKVILSPNRSLTWQANLWVLASFFAVSLFISVGVLLKGAWVIVPFAGIELALLAFAMCYVQRRTRLTEVIYIDDRRLLIERGIGSPQCSWSFCRPGASIMVHSDNPFADDQHVCVCGDQGIVEVGEFLNPSDRALLVKDLTGCGLRASRHLNWSALPA